MGIHLVDRFPRRSAEINGYQVGHHATRDRYIAVYGVQEPELLDHQEPEDNAGSLGVQQVLPEVPETYAAQGSEVVRKFRGVSSTVKLPVSKTGLGGSNPSAPARLRSAAVRRR